VPTVFSTETTFAVTDATGGQLGGQAVLVMLSPTDPQNWNVAVWRTVTPWPGGTVWFTASGIISAYAFGFPANGRAQTNAAGVPAGFVAPLQTSAHGEPVLGAAATASSFDSPTAGGTSSGVKNLTASPAYAMYVAWNVDDALVATSTDPLPAGGGLSAFELDGATYWAIGVMQGMPLPPSAGMHAQLRTPQQAYVVPPGVTDVAVTLGYDTASAQYTWTFDPPSASRTF
jgi:hypothetical protein